MTLKKNLTQREQDKFVAVGADTAVRTITTDSSGNTIGDGDTYSYEDTSFVTGESPRVLDVNTDLGRNASDGYIINDGAGDIKVEFSGDGIDYGGQHTIKNGDVLDFKNLKINKIRLTWVSNSSYRILVI